MGYFVGLSTTLVFGKKKSLLAASRSSQRICVYVGVELELRREAKRSSFQFLEPWSLCGMGIVKGLWFPSTYPSIPKQNYLNIFILLPEFLLLFWTLFLPYWTPSFQWCVKCDWKLSYLGLWHCLWFPENGMGKFALFPLVSCLLTASLFCAVPRTKLVNDFFTGTSVFHSYCE